MPRLAASRWIKNEDYHFKDQMMKTIFPLLWSILLAGFVHAEEQKKRPISLNDFFAIQRVVDPQISPDGKHVVYGVGRVDMDSNRVLTHFWIAPTDRQKPPYQLTNAAK